MDAATSPGADWFYAGGSGHTAAYGAEVKDRPSPEVLSTTVAHQTEFVKTFLAPETISWQLYVIMI